MTIVKLDDIRVEGRHRRDLGDIAALAASIEDVGLLQPPVVTPDLRLVAGERRIAALRKLGRTEVRVHTVANLSDAAALLRAERDENTQRKEMTPSEKVALAEALRDIMKAEAKQRQRHHGGTAPGRSSDTSENFTEVSSRKPVRERLGEMVGMSGITYDRARAVVKGTEDDDPAVREVAEQALDEMDRTGKVTPAFDRLARATGRKAAYDGRRKKPVEETANGRSTGDRLERARLIRQYASEGYTSRQMAKKVGVTVETVRAIARDHDIEIPADRLISKTHHINSTRVARETVFAIEGAAAGLDLIDYDDIDPSEVAEWATSLDASLRDINRFARKIKEVAHGYQQE